MNCICPRSEDLHGLNQDHCNGENCELNGSNMPDFYKNGDNVIFRDVTCDSIVFSVVECMLCTASVILFPGIMTTDGRA
jgi:hypothetical protein